MNERNRTGPPEESWSLRLSRRQLLKAGAVAPLSAAFLAACGTAATPAPTSVTPAPTAPPAGTPAPAKEDFSGVTINIACNPSSIKAAEAAAPLWGALTGGTAKAAVVPFAERALKFASAIVSKDPFFDLYFASKDFVAKFGDKLYVDVDTLGIDLSDFVPGTLAQLSRNGKKAALPLFADQEFFIYNKSMFREAGADPENPPDTWEALYALAAKLNVGPREPCVMPWVNSGVVYWLCYYNPTGGKFLSDDKLEVLFENENALAAWDALDKGFKAKWYGPGGNNAASDLDTAKLFNQGLGASQMGLVEFWSQARSKNVKDYNATINPDDVGVKPLPGITSGLRGSVLVTEGWGVGVYSQHKEAATSFLRYVTGVEYQKKLLSGVGEVVIAPNRISVLNDPATKASFAPGAVLAEQAKGELSWPGTPYEIDPIWTLAYNNLLKGTWTAKQAHEETVKQTKEAIVKYLSA